MTFLLYYWLLLYLIICISEKVSCLLGNPESILSILDFELFSVVCTTKHLTDLGFLNVYFSI